MLYALKLTLIFLVTVPAAILIFLLGLFDPHGRRVYGISRVWSWLILAAGRVSLKVEGLGQLNTGRQYIFMVNHQSNLDIPALFCGLSGFQLRWIAKRELLYVPFFGWAMWAAKHIIVDRGDRVDARESLRQAQKLMAGGISVVIFPEGTRSADGRLLPFKRGGFLLAAKTRGPIVPVTINGSGKLLPKGDWRIRSGQISITVSAPIATENYRPGALRALAARVEETIGTNLFDPAQPARGVPAQNPRAAIPAATSEGRAT